MPVRAQPDLEARHRHCHLRDEESLHRHEDRDPRVWHREVARVPRPTPNSKISKVELIDLMKTVLVNPKV